MCSFGRAAAFAIATVCTVGILPLADGASHTPGTVNYVEGRVTLDGSLLSREGSESTTVGPGQVIQTDQGKAEVLLTPGVFVRLADNSALKVVTESASAMRVELLHGEALVEVIEIEKQNHLEVIAQRAYTRLLREGIYEFHAEQAAIQVYEGKARVEDDQRQVAVGQGREVSLNSRGLTKPEKFDIDRTDGLYSWSEQRAAYAATVSESTVESLLALDPGMPYDAGWYWNPWFEEWGYVPEEGYRLSPFLYGFYAPNRVQNLTPVFHSIR